MAYLSKVLTSLPGACALLFMLAVPGFASPHITTTMATSHTFTHRVWKDKEDEFLCILYTANHMVLARYPQAQFYEAQGTPQNGQGMAEHDVHQWLFVFNDPSTTPNSTVELPYQNGHFGEMQHIASPFLEDLVIPLPLHTGLHEAIKILRQQYSAPFTALTVRFPLALQTTEPYYIFTIPSVNLYVFVGINTHHITTEGMA